MAGYDSARLRTSAPGGHEAYEVPHYGGREESGSPRVPDKHRRRSRRAFLARLLFLLLLAAVAAHAFWPAAAPKEEGWMGYDDEEAEHEAEGEFLLPLEPSHTQDQPFYSHAAAPALPDYAFERLARAVEAPELALRPNEHPDGLSSGLLAFFSAEGAEVLRDCPLFVPLAPFFFALRSEDANAFAFRVLRREPQGAPASSEAGDKPDFALGVHLDNSLRFAMPIGWNGVSHNTHTLTVAAPPDVVGGSLELWEPDLRGGRQSGLQTGTAEGWEWDEAVAEWSVFGGAPETERHPAGTCQAGSWWGAPRVAHAPVPNSIVSYRGDSAHRTQPHASGAEAEEAATLTLLLEEYILPEWQLRDLPTFHVWGQDAEGVWPEYNAVLEPCREMLAPLLDLTYQLAEEGEAAEEAQEGEGEDAEGEGGEEGNAEGGEGEQVDSNALDEESVPY